MALTPDEQAQLAALTAKASEPDPPADPEPVVEAAGEVAADVGAAVAEAVADTAEAVAEAVADTEPDVTIEAPDPVAEGEAAAAVIRAQADAEVAVIDAQAGADIARMEAAAELAADEPESVDVLDDLLGPVEEMIAPDASPAPAHRWFRKFGGQ